MSQSGLTSRSLFTALLAPLVVAMPLFAAEVHSNGVGGGNWSAPSTWKTRAVPTADDLVVIARGDFVSFDRDDSDKITCAQLSIDSRGGLEFKPSAGTVVMCVNGPIESYGAIKMDAIKLARDTDKMELRFVSKDFSGRSLKLLKGSSLQVRGRNDEKTGVKNAGLLSMPGGAPAMEFKAGDPSAMQATIDANTGVSLDIVTARVADVILRGTNINNTGSKSNERLNISDCKFTNTSRVEFQSCDTASLIKCTFGEPGKLNPLPRPGPMWIMGCQLPQVCENKFYGYTASAAVVCEWGAEPSISDNVFENCVGAMHFDSIDGVVLKHNKMINCEGGLSFRTTSGVLEQTSFDGVKNGVRLDGSGRFQFTDLDIKNQPEGGKVFTVQQAYSIRLLNANVTPAQIAVQTPKGSNVVVSCNYFVIVKVDGKVSREKQRPAVNIVRENITPPLAAGASDLAVRNAPAVLYDNDRTALPATLRAITVRGWEILSDGSVKESPEYRVEVGGLVMEGPKGDQEEVFKGRAVAKFRPDEKFYRNPSGVVDAPTLTVSP